MTATFICDYLFRLSPGKFNFKVVINDVWAASTEYIIPGLVEVKVPTPAQLLELETSGVMDQAMVIFVLKGSASVISSVVNLQAKIWQCPIYKRCLIKNKLDINVYHFENYLLTYIAAGTHNGLSELNTFKSRKATISSMLLIRKSFQRYRCESVIVIFSLRVT